MTKELQPEICVLLSAYKGSEFISEQLDSIIRQKDVKLHILIRDDGSDDCGKTLSALSEYKKEYPDIIEVLPGENVGFVKSFTRALDYALNNYKNVDYFAFADQDDVWLSDKLISGYEKVKDTESHSPEDTPVAYCSNTTLVDRNLKFISDAWDPSNVRVDKATAIVENFATGCTMVFNRVAAGIYVDRFNDDVRVHDAFLYMICVYFGKMIFDPKSHILYRQHGNNQIGSPGFIERWKHRLMFKKKKKRVIEKKALMFLNAFDDKLSDDDKALLKQAAYYRKSIFGRFSFAMDKRFRMSTRERQFIKTMKIIRGDF